jgi:hypothetical protein
MYIQADYPLDDLPGLLLLHLQRHFPERWRHHGEHKGRGHQIYHRHYQTADHGPRGELHQSYWAEEVHPRSFYSGPRKIKKETEIRRLPVQYSKLYVHLARCV